jgi:hypothetical protein
MRQFPYADHQVAHFVKVTKTVQEGKIAFKEFDPRHPGSMTARISLFSDQILSAIVELSITAGDTKDPTTYHAALLVNSERVRGVDFNRSGARTRGYKIRIPAGWHENIDYPLHPKDNRHDPLDLGDVTDLRDFARKICKLWHIEYPEQDQPYLM